MNEPVKKVVRLRTDDTAITAILNDLLELNIKDDLKGLIIIASTNENGMNNIHRFWFDEDRTCTQVLGLLEYMKMVVKDHIREDLKGEGGI
jgi:hypothetical protein